MVDKPLKCLYGYLNLTVTATAGLRNASNYPDVRKRTELYDVKRKLKLL